ncbi:hypothetical protein D3C78_1124300 [compost metagenome]
MRRDQRCADRFQSRIEGSRNVAIGFRYIAADAGLQIACSKGRQCGAQQRRRFRAVTVTLLGQLPAMAQAQFVKTQRDGDFRVDHHQTDDVLHGFRQFTGFLAVAGQDGAWRMFGHQSADKMFQNHRVAGDLPARIKPHAAGIIRENLHPLGIKRIETRIRQNAPVRGLQIVQSVELIFTFEGRGTVRHGLETGHHVPQAGLDVRLQHAAIAAQEIGLRLIEAGKTQPSRQASACRPARLI